MRRIGVVGVLALTSCHGTREDRALEYALEIDAGPGASCTEGYLLQSRYLGEAFALQTRTLSFENIKLTLAPVLEQEEAAALWILERDESEGPGAFRIRNLGLIRSGLPSMFLSSVASVARDDGEGDDGIWLVESAAPEHQADVPLFVLRPKSSQDDTLATNRASPYFPLTAPEGGGAREHWRLTPYQLCDGL